MKVKISFAVAVLFVNSALLADSTTIVDALKNGKINGEFFLYAEQADVSDGDNYGFGSGSFDLGFKTDSLYDFTFSVGSRANHKFWKIHSGDYPQNTKAILHTANIAYSHPHLDVLFGRQEINLNWVSDFHEALVLVGKGIPYTTIVAGYTQRIAVADGDQPLRDFDKIGDSGAFVIDAKYEGIKDIVLNPYVYYAEDIAAWTGVKATYDADFGEFQLGGTLQYARSDEDTGEDGSFLQAEARGTFGGVNAALGFMKTDKDGGVGSMNAIGENINFFEDGEQIFNLDADTFYISLNSKWNRFVFGGIFGSTDYDGGKMREFDLTVSYDLNNNLNLYGAFVNGNGEGDNDYNKILAQAVYSF
ncbi:MAG: Opr family porin [Campylobacteraceae bacterium]|jgi:hypothetical protein|nr:Opr family porin [Campylobacteraceae bacterium]